MKKNVTKTFIGVDVSKDTLAIHLHPQSIYFTVENSAKGIEELLGKLATHNVEQIVCESSGGYETLALGALRSVDYKVWQVDPSRIKAFIRSEGIKAKTDKSDAAMIALFASQKTCKYERKGKSEKELKLQALVRRKADLVAMIAAEKCRFKNPSQIGAKSFIDDHIEFMEKQAEMLEQQIAQIIENDDEWNRKAQILVSVPGVGKISVAALISEMPELGTVTNKQAAALLGVAPYTIESGNYRGVAVIKGGRSIPRNVLYMATMSAVRCNSTLKIFYNRLLKAGKKRKVAIVAAMHKLITILNSMLKYGKKWTPPAQAFD
jgi:transposase